jgi:hypothetical protein
MMIIKAHICQYIYWGSAVEVAHAFLPIFYCQRKRTICDRAKFILPAVPIDSLWSPLEAFI